MPLVADKHNIRIKNYYYEKVQFLTNTKDIKDVGRNNLTKKQNQKPIR
jgi:hypothetical protein